MQGHDAHDMKCNQCGYVLKQNNTTPNPICPACGGDSWLICVDVHDNVGMIEEFVAEGSDSTGKITAERLEKSDNVTRSSFSINAGEPSQIGVTREKRVKGFDEEGAAANSFINAYNHSHGTDYVIADKTIEDSEYADRVLVSKSNPKQWLNIQIRNLDTEIIASLGKKGRFKGQRSPAQLIESIKNAVEDKARVDSQLKRNTVLLLITQTALGKINRQAIEMLPIDSKGFKEIWISPFHEDSFRLTVTP